MPKAKYQKDQKSGLYYTFVKTNEVRADGYAKYKKISAKTCAVLDEKVAEYNRLAMMNLTQNKITVDEWEGIWFSTYKAGLKPNTTEYYTRLYDKHIKPAIGNMKLTDVKEAHCQRILTALSSDHAEKTVKSVRSELYSIFDKARANHLIYTNPAEKLSAQGAAKKERRALTDAERKLYLKACQSASFALYALVVYFFGLRRGEAVALKGSDFKNGYLNLSRQATYPGNNQPVISTPKTAAGTRSIPIPTKAYKYIDFDALPDGWLFPGDNGSVLSCKELKRRWTGFLSDTFGADTDITTHYLRHNYCTMLFEQGVDLLTVKEICGHEDINTTMEIYTHYTESLKKKGIKKALNIG